jgi:hypothetical protein
MSTPSMLQEVTPSSIASVDKMVGNDGDVMLVMVMTMIAMMIF